MYFIATSHTNIYDYLILGSSKPNTAINLQRDQG